MFRAIKISKALCARLYPEVEVLLQSLSMRQVTTKFFFASTALKLSGAGFSGGLLSHEQGCQHKIK